MEQATVHKILEKGLQRSDGGESVISVLATATRGRIYAEARSIVLVIELARSIAELNPAKVSLVPAEDVFHIFNFSPSPGSSSWPWVRGAFQSEEMEMVCGRHGAHNYD